MAKYENGCRKMSKVLDFIQNTKFEDLPDAVVDYARDCLFDTLGIAAAAVETDLSRIISNHAVRQFASNANEKSTLLFDGRTASPTGAALAGGMSLDAVDGHDGFALAKGHIGAAVIPSLFAAYEALADDRLDPNGKEFITLLVVGYEIASRAGLSLHSTVDDYHTSGAWNALGCATVVGRLLGLDDEKMRHALGIAEYHGPRSQMMRLIDHSSMLKDGSGWGAMAGTSAAFMAADGFTGAPAITVEAEEVSHYWNDLGERWCILEQNFKAYPVCRWAQPAMEGARSALTSSGKTWADITSIEVQTFHEATRLAGANPTNTDEAQYSIAFPVASILIFGEIGARHIMGDALTNPDVLKLSNMVQFVERADFNEVFPKERFAAVRLGFSDGSDVLSEPHRPRGDPGVTTLTRNDLKEKFHRMANPVLGEDRSESILSYCLGLGTASGSIQELIEALKQKA
jgi:2-methylcitrate dehydratase PrpD